MRICKKVWHNGVLRLLYIPSVAGATQGCVMIASLISSSVARLVILQESVLRKDITMVKREVEAVFIGCSTRQGYT